VGEPETPKNYYEGQKAEHRQARAEKEIIAPVAGTSILDERAAAPPSRNHKDT
jgi:hypothetical protein